MPRLMAAPQAVGQRLDRPGRQQRGIALVEVRRDLRQRHLPQPGDQHRLRLPHRGRHGGVDRLFDQALRIGVGRADREDARLAHRAINVEDTDRVERTGQGPAAAMPLFRADIARVAQARHGPADHDRIGRQAGRQHVRGHRSAAALFVLGHVQQGMKDVGEAGVSFHVTSIVT